MTFFTHASIKRKLMLITTVTSSLALLLASAGFVLYDLAAFRTRMSQDLMTQAEIISANSMAALAFKDERTVSEFLGALRAKEEIEAAAIYAPDGRVFAVYHRDPQRRRDCRRDPRRPATASTRTRCTCSTTSCCTSNRSARSTSSPTCSSGTRRLRNYTAIVGVLMLGRRCSPCCCPRACSGSSHSRSSISSRP